MSKSQLDATSLLAALVGAVLALTLLPGTFAWLGSICGLVLATVLVAYDREGYRTVFESLAYSAVFAFCLIPASAALLRIMAGGTKQLEPVEGRIASEWMPLIWAGVMIVFCLIDRARMGGRVPQTGLPAVSTTLSLSQMPAPRASEAPRPTVREPATVSAAPEPAPPPAAPTPAAPAPQAVALPPGKETSIYVALVGEGMNVLRAVRAEHVGRDFYKIIEPMPDGETWEYGPGQIVRCRKKNLSSGKALVATEEAPRAR